MNGDQSMVCNQVPSWTQQLSESAQKYAKTLLNFLFMIIIASIKISVYFFTLSSLSCHVISGHIVIKICNPLYRNVNWELLLQISPRALFIYAPQPSNSELSLPYSSNRYGEVDMKRQRNGDTFSTGFMLSRKWMASKLMNTTYFTLWLLVHEGVWGKIKLECNRLSGKCTHVLCNRDLVWGSVYWAHFRLNTSILIS